MPWDGALPMLRHGRLQLKVIAFPVPPPLFFSSSPLLPPPVPRFLFFTKRCVSPSSSRSSPLLFVPRLLPSSSPLSHSRLSLASAGTSFTRWPRSSSSAFDSTARVSLWAHVCVCVCVCVRMGEPVCVRERERWRWREWGKRWAYSEHAGPGMLCTHTQKNVFPMIDLLSLAHSFSLAFSFLHSSY